MVLDIIKQQPVLADNPFAFAAGKGNGEFNSFRQRKAELDEKLPDMPDWVLHDLRRTVRSLMAKAGVADNIAERVLGHVIAGIQGIYNRHDYVEGKADAFGRLAAHVETILNPPEGNVVAMMPKRKK